MCIQDLPEELLTTILELCLLLPPADFFIPARTQHKNYHRVRLGISPACDLLLVCRQWARIGTPLLYSSLLLVSKRDAARVAPHLAAHPRQPRRQSRRRSRRFDRRIGRPSKPQSRWT